MRINRQSICTRLMGMWCQFSQTTMLKKQYLYTTTINNLASSVAIWTNTSTSLYWSYTNWHFCSSRILFILLTSFWSCFDKSANLWNFNVNLCLLPDGIWCKSVRGWLWPSDSLYHLIHISLITVRSLSDLASRHLTKYLSVKENLTFRVPSQQLESYLGRVSCYQHKSDL